MYLLAAKSSASGAASSSFHLIWTTPAFLRGLALWLFSLASQKITLIVSNEDFEELPDSWLNLLLAFYDTSLHELSSKLFDALPKLIQLAAAWACHISSFREPATQLGWLPCSLPFKLLI